MNLFNNFSALDVFSLIFFFQINFKCNFMQRQRKIKTLTFLLFSQKKNIQRKAAHLTELEQKQKWST